MAKKDRKRRKAHVKKRLSQRYGITGSKEQRAEIKKLIEDGECILVEKDTTRQSSTYDVPYGPKILRIVYNHKLKQIVTALPGPRSARFKVLYKDKDGNRQIVEIHADGKLQAAGKVMCAHGARQVVSVTPLRHI